MGEAAGPDQNDPTADADPAWALAEIRRLREQHLLRPRRPDARPTRQAPGPDRYRTPPQDLVRLVNAMLERGRGDLVAINVVWGWASDDRDDSAPVRVDGATLFVSSGSREAWTPERMHAVLGRLHCFDGLMHISEIRPLTM